MADLIELLREHGAAEGEVSLSTLVSFCEDEGHELHELVVVGAVYTSEYEGGDPPPRADPP